MAKSPSDEDCGCRLGECRCSRFQRAPHPFLPRKPPVYPPVPPLPTDPDFGLIDRFYQARLKGDREEIEACIRIAMPLVGPSATKWQTYESRAWERVAYLLGIPGQDRTTLARIRHLLGIS